MGVTKQPTHTKTPSRAAAPKAYKPSRRSPREITMAEDAERLQSVWKAYKARTGMTQKAFAAQLGMSAANFGHYLHGKALMDMDILVQFCTRFEVSVDDLSPSAAQAVRVLSGITQATDSQIVKSKKRVLSEMAGRAIADSGLDEQGVTALISFLKVATPPAK